MTIDSFDYNYIKKANNFSRLMPFLYNFKNKCLYANNLFSEGPYTEAGIKSLLTGKNTLENNGYFLRLGNEKSNVFEYFKDAGYQINASFMADDMYSNSIISKMDHFYFTSSMHFSTFWNRRFELYSEIIKVRDLTRQELVDLMELVELIFYSYELFLDKGLDERHDMIK
ncbi:MAG: sulfatase-like hydrolase/transferase, partial [Clostridia bacterium]